MTSSPDLPTRVCLCGSLMCLGISLSAITPGRGSDKESKATVAACGVIAEKTPAGSQPAKTLLNRAHDLYRNWGETVGYASLAAAVVVTAVGSIFSFGIPVIVTAIALLLIGFWLLATSEPEFSDCSESDALSIDGNRSEDESCSLGAVSDDESDADTGVGSNPTGTGMLRSDSSTSGVTMEPFKPAKANAAEVNDPFIGNATRAVYLA